MAFKLCMWFLIATFVILAISCFWLSASCFRIGGIPIVGFLMAWFGLIPSATAAFLWWMKNDLAEMLEDMFDESRP